MRPPNVTEGRAQVLVTVTLLGVVTFAVLPLLAGRAVPHWDANLAFAPSHALVADYARHGQLVWWNPWSLAGNPDFADPELGTLSPVAVGVGLVSGGGLKGFAAYWMSIWLLAGIGVQLLARSWGVSPAAGAVAALSYAFSGFFTGHAEHVSVLSSAAALPFVVWRFDRAVLGRNRLAALQAGSILGLSALGGYPGITVQTAGFLLFWAAARTVLPDEPGLASSLSGRARAAAEAFALTAAVSLLVLAPCYGGFFFEAVAHAERVEALDPRNALTNSLAPSALATFASPFLPSLALERPSIWGDNDVSSASIYMGPVVPVVALSALVGAKARFRWALVAGAVAALALSLGHALPLRAWVNVIVPGFRHFRHPAMTRLFFVFSCVALALTALRSLPNEPRRWTPILAAAAVALGAAVLSFRASVLGSHMRPPGLSLAEPLYLLAWGAVFGVALLGRLGAFRGRAPVAGLVLAAIAIADAAADAYLSRPITLDMNSEAVAKWARLAHRQVRTLTLPSLDRKLGSAGGGNHDLLTKTPVLESYSPFRRPEQDAWFTEPALRAAAVGANRIFFSPTAASAALDEAGLRDFVNRTRSLGSPPIVVPAEAARIASLVDLETAPAATRVPVRLVEYTPRRLVFDVDVPAPGWLLVTDRWAPSWRARLNGDNAEVFRSDFLFRGLRVPAGHVHVELSYRPIVYVALLAVSWCVLAAVVLISVRSTWR